MRVISLKNKLGLLRQKMSIENYSRKRGKVKCDKLGTFLREQGNLSRRDTV